MKYKYLKGDLWEKAQLKPYDILVKEITSYEEAKTTGGIVVVHSQKSNEKPARIYEVVKMGELADEADPRLNVGKIIVPVIELAHLHTPDRYMVLDSDAIGVVFNPEDLQAGDENENV